MARSFPDAPPSGVWELAHGNGNNTALPEAIVPQVLGMLLAATEVQNRSSVSEVLRLVQCCPEGVPTVFPA